MSLLIKNAKIFYKGNLVKKNIFVSGSKIRKIISNEIIADKIIDAKENIVIPGLIDPHVHFREPGLTYKEDFFSGSMAAAAGGVTTILDMPNTKPETTTIKNLEEKRKLARKSIVNYGFHFGAAVDNIEEIKKVKNVASIKIFMNHSTGNMKIDDDNVLKEIFKNSRLVFVHAEGDKVNKAIELNEDYGNSLYLAHISLSSEIKEIKKAKAITEKRIFAEVTPHHLFLSNDDFEQQRGFADMRPSLKTKEDQKALLQAINDNIIDTIGTDHAPHTHEEKMNTDYPYGIPGIETSLPLLLNAVNKEKLTIKKIVELCCENPAKIFKLKGKGFIEEGFDADLTIIDMNLEKEVNNDELFTKCRWSPFNGWNLMGWPVTTIVNGNIIYDKGNIDAIKAREVEYYE